MAKGQFWDDTIEKLGELGKSTAKETVKSVKDTLSPVKMIEQAAGLKSSSQDIQKEAAEMKKKSGSTPLDFEKLNNNYSRQDKIRTEALRMKLFNMVKKDDEEMLRRQEQKEEEKTRRELYEKEEKKRRLIEQKKLQEQGQTPRGRVRKSIFSPKKVAQREQIEVKANTGKQ